MAVWSIGLPVSQLDRSTKRHKTSAQPRNGGDRLCTTAEYAEHAGAEATDAGPLSALLPRRSRANLLCRQRSHRSQRRSSVQTLFCGPCVLSRLVGCGGGAVYSEYSAVAARGLSGVAWPHETDNLQVQSANRPTRPTDRPGSHARASSGELLVPRHLINWAAEDRTDWY